jgi:radical SAM superfamily enzyme YgiQ (UPF0313 family)
VASAGPEERGAIRKEPGGRLGVALVYPNVHGLGMANLGVHAVYRLLNAHPDVRCERAFLPDDGGEPRTVESGAPLRAFDVVAFSLSFEDDHLNVLRLLAGAGIPLRAARRDEGSPLVVAGGIAVQINPEPVAPFFDALLVGEGEALLAPFLGAVRTARDARASRAELLRALAGLEGAYVPGLVDVEYADTRAPAGRWVLARRPRDGVPSRVARAFLPDLRGVATSRAVDTPGATFGDLYLTEVARGCLWGCRFCAAGFVQRPYREVDLATLEREAREGIARGQRVGLVGPDTSDHSGLDALTAGIAAAGGTFSPSSLRVDAIGPVLARRMAEGGERTVTLAPEAGTERLRRVVNKELSDDRIVRAAEDAIGAGMTGVKLYFMCGLPTETEEDVRGMAALALRIREEVMQPWARRRGRAGRITLSVNPFVPKPWTPFQWAPLAPREALEGARRLLERTLRPKGIEVESLSARAAYLQTLLSRGDRRVADLLELAHAETGGGLRAALRRWPHDPDFFVRREVGVEEDLPWDVLDQGVTKEWLAREWQRGRDEKLTPKCAVSTCRACGLDCADRQEPAGVSHTVPSQR